MPFLEWYRPLPARRMGKVIAWGVAALIIGTVLVGMAAYDRNVIGSLRPLFGVVGGVLVVSAPLILLLGFQKLLFREEWFLALKLDGIEVKLPGLAVTILWDDLERAKTGETGQLELHTRRGEIYRVEERFAGHQPAEIAKRIDAARRRILHNLPVTGGTS
jgi:hypothetical protein